MFVCLSVTGCTYCANRRVCCLSMSLWSWSMPHHFNSPVPTADSAEILKHKSQIVPTPCSLLPFLPLTFSVVRLDRVTSSRSVMDCGDLVSDAVVPSSAPAQSQCDYQPCSVSCVTAELNSHRNSFSPGWSIQVRLNHWLLSLPSS